MNNIKKSLLIVALTICSIAAQAQKNETESTRTTPRWVSDKGYWVVETNIKIPNVSTVRFYSNDNQLVYTEKVNGLVINLCKKKTLKKLKTVLENVIGSWELEGVVKTETALFDEISGKRKGA